MEAVWQWGVDIIIIIQKIRSPFFDHLFVALTAMGNDMFYMLILPLLYWCADKKRTARLFYLFLFSSWLNSISKDLFNQPRPYNLNSSVKIGNTTGPGIPSGHAQGSFLFWGYLSVWVGKRWFTIFCIAIILLVGLSRLYLGVHFPTDLLGGWVLALILLVVYARVVDRLEALLSKLSMARQIALGLIIPAVLALLLPSKWSVSPMGIAAGFTVALVIETRQLNFGPPRNLLNGIARYLLGIAGFFAIYIGIRLLLFRGSSFHLAFMFIQYFFMGIWVGWGAPFLFRKTGLDPATREEGQSA